MGGNAIAFVHLFPLWLLNWLIFGIDLLHMCGSGIETKGQRWELGSRCSQSGQWWNCCQPTQTQTWLKVCPRSRSEWQHLDCDLQFKSPANNGCDPHTCKRSRPKVSQFKRRNRQMDRQKEASALPTMLTWLVTSMTIPQVTVDQYQAAAWMHHSSALHMHKPTRTSHTVSKSCCNIPQ